MKNKILTLSLLIFLLSPLAIFSQNDECLSDFFEEENISNYFYAIDTLIEKSEKSIYPSIEEMKKSKNIPQITTDNGIKLVYTIYKENSIFVYHLSVSSPCYMASLYAKNIVSLFSLKSGLSTPNEIQKSPRGVYHAIWEMDKLPDKKYMGVKYQDNKRLFDTALGKAFHINLKEIQF